MSPSILLKKKKKKKKTKKKKNLMLNLWMAGPKEILIKELYHLLHGNEVSPGVPRTHWRRLICWEL